MAIVYRELRLRKSLEMYDFDGSIKSVRAFIDELANEYGEDAMIDFDQSWDSVEVTLHYRRLETGVERDRRLAKAAKDRAKATESAAKREEKERAEYERLQAKFGAGA